MFNHSDGPETKNPDALAGAVGADRQEALDQEDSHEAEAYSNRMRRSIALYHAIWAAHPNDAADIMTEELLRRSAGTPPHDVFGTVREDARWWAVVATPTELVEYMVAALRVVPGRRTALCLLRAVTLGEDRDGDRVTTCVVERAAEGEEPRRATVKGKAEIALQALHTGLEMHGAVRSGPDYPDQRSVTKVQWKEAAEMHGRFEGLNEEAAKKAFNRALSELHDKALARSFNGIWWLA